MIKILATVAVVGAMLAGGITTLPILPEKVLFGNSTILTFYDNSDNFAFVTDGEIKITNGATGETIKTWPVEGSIVNVNSDFCVSTNTAPGKYTSYHFQPSGKTLVSGNPNYTNLMLDGEGSYARLPNYYNTEATETPNQLKVYPTGKSPYVINLDKTNIIGKVGKHSNYLYYLIFDKTDSKSFWLAICDFATGAEHFRIKSESGIYNEASFYEDKVVFGQSVYNIATKTKIFTLKDSVPRFFGGQYYSLSFDNTRITYSLLDEAGLTLKSRKVDYTSNYRLVSMYGGFLVDVDKDKNIVLMDAFDETTPAITLPAKKQAQFQVFPLSTKLILLQGSEISCFDYFAKKPIWTKSIKNSVYQVSWSLPIIHSAQDGKENTLALDYASEELIQLPEGYNRAVKGESVIWILSDTITKDAPWALVYSDGKPSPAASESYEGKIISAYDWKNTLLAFIAVKSEEKTGNEYKHYELVQVKNGEKTVLYKTEDPFEIPSYQNNRCVISSKTKITDINIETLEQKETKLVKPTSFPQTYYPWVDGYLCKLSGSVGYVQNGKTVKTFKGTYVSNDDTYLTTYHAPNTTEVDEEGNTYKYGELLKYDTSGNVVESTIIKNNLITPSKLDENLYYVGNTIIDKNAAKLQTIQNFEKTGRYATTRFVAKHPVTMSIEYNMQINNILKWAPCATYTADFAEGKLVVKNTSTDAGKVISGQLSFAFISKDDGLQIANMDGSPIDIDNLAPDKEFSIDVGAIPEGKKLVFIAEANGMLDIGLDPSNDFKVNRDRYVGVPMSKKIGFARAVRVLE